VSHLAARCRKPLGRRYRHVPSPGRQTIGPTVRALQAAGATSLRAIAAGLNEQGIPTARGAGKWSAVQVARVLDRLD
jgi:hypothetical protein